MENSSRDGNTRPPDLPPEKFVCRSRSNSYNWTWDSELIPNLDRSMSRLYIVTCLFHLYAEFSSVQSLSRVRLFATPWIAPRQASLSITNSRSSLRFKFIESVIPSSHLILCRHLLLLPPIPTSIKVFANKSTLQMRWPKYWSFSFSIIPSKKIPGLISFRMDLLDLFAV